MSLCSRSTDNIKSTILQARETKWRSIKGTGRSQRLAIWILNESPGKMSATQLIEIKVFNITPSPKFISWVSTESLAHTIIWVSPQCHCDLVDDVDLVEYFVV